MKRLSLILILMGFMCLACDNGAVDDPGERADPLSMTNEQWDTKCAALSLSDDVPLASNPVFMEPFKMPRIDMRVFPWVAPEADETEEEDDTPDFCDCTGMCNACMDAYICGHEAAILEYCDECAQCQKECNPETEDS